VTRDGARLLARDYLHDGAVMQVASFPLAGPKLIHVWYAADDALHLYFASDVGRFGADEPVAFGVVDQELEGLGQRVRGITGRGQVSGLMGQVLVDGYAAYASRWGQVLELFPLADMVSGTSRLTIFRLVPQELVLFDQVNFPDQPRQVIDL
jgi:hypothetical protein